MLFCRCYTVCRPKVGTQFFLVHKFLGSFRNNKSNSKVFQFANRKSENLQQKKQIQVPIGLPLLFFLPTQVYFRLQNAMELCLKTIPKAKTVLKFECKHFKLIFERRTIQYLRICKSSKSANRKSANCHICGRYSIQTNLISANLRIFALRNLFAHL
jgi:hypothetical protein